MDNQLHITPDELLYMSYALAKKVHESGWKPDWLVALWRGGAPIGIAVQEFLEYKGCSVDHIAIRTSSYEMGVQGKEIRVHGLHYIIENANSNNKVLIVDDIYETGRSIKMVMDQLKSKMRANFPEVRIATLFYKPHKNTTGVNPDYFMETTDKWIVFPHEVEGMSLEQITASKGERIGELFR